MITIAPCSPLYLNKLKDTTKIKTALIKKLHTQAKQQNM